MTIGGAELLPRRSFGLSPADTLSAECRHPAQPGGAHRTSLRRDCLRVLGAFTVLANFEPQINIIHLAACVY